MDITKRSDNPSEPHLLDFNRTCYKFFVKETTSSRDFVDKLLNRELLATKIG
ncbi:protein of unknown function [Legionella hackeliae]|uniref:Uncharacterized protein n=1 Tax=Legionella hackeliae TaxID=449 RepID=A0A0A8UTC9_LEGHA|nr:protein of unknown function [Legionella hackeliae]